MSQLLFSRLIKPQSKMWFHFNFPPIPFVLLSLQYSFVRNTITEAHSRNAIEALGPRSSSSRPAVSGTLGHQKCRKFHLNFSAFLFILKLFGLWIQNFFSCICNNFRIQASKRVHCPLAPCPKGAWGKVIPRDSICGKRYRSTVVELSSTFHLLPCGLGTNALARIPQPAPQSGQWVWSQNQTKHSAEGAREMLLTVPPPLPGWLVLHLISSPLGKAPAQEPIVVWWWPHAGI